MFKKSIVLIASLFVSSSVFAADDYLVDSSPETVEGAELVDTKRAKELFDSGALFIDVRSEKANKKGRIPDSAFLDLKKGFSKETLMDEANIDEDIVIYCQGIKCKRAAVAAQKALIWGFKKVYYYREGFPGWKKAGYPFDAG